MAFEQPSRECGNHNELIYQVVGNRGSEGIRSFSAKNFLLKIFFLAMLNIV
jgi:hypothetical protein